MLRRNTINACMIIVAALVLLSGCKDKNDSKGNKCGFCSMAVKLPDDVQGAKIVFRDGSEEYFCVMGHAMMGWKIENGREGNPDNPPVGLYAVDYASKKLIDAQKAFYVFGSDVHSPMFAKSAIAFSDKAAAETFVQAHAGKVMDFETLKKQNLNEMKEELKVGALM